MSVQYSGRLDGRTERYVSILTRGRRIASIRVRSGRRRGRNRRRRCRSTRPTRVPLGRTGLRGHPARVRRRLDRRAVRGGRRRRRDRDRRSRLGPRHPLLRRRAAVRLRRRRSDGMGAALARPAARRVRPVDEGRPPRPARRPRSRRAPTSTARRSTAARTPTTSDAEPVRIVFDYSADGVRRSIEESLERLGLDRIDIALIHDPDDHWEAAIGEAYPALARLREEGVDRGDRRRDEPVGDARPVRPRGRRSTSSWSPAATRCSTRTRSPSCCRCASSAASPSSSAGVMNSGVLADPRPGGRFDYAPAPPEVVERARGSATPARATASRSEPPRSSSRSPTRPSPRSSPASAGSTTSTSTRRSCGHPIPADLWAELRAEGLIAARRAGAGASA